MSNNQPRSFKFYRKNEEEVMKSLGLKPTKNSGSGWIEKEDGMNEFVICQLKSTDAQSIKVNQKDIRILEHNAAVAHKLPMFAIQFLNTGEVWLMAKPEDFTEISKYIETGSCKVNDVSEFLGIEETEDTNETSVRKRIIGSASNAREEFYRNKQKKYNKTKSAI